VKDAEAVADLDNRALLLLEADLEAADDSEEELDALEEAREERVGTSKLSRALDEVAADTLADGDF
jgi:hypothetical protein